MAMISSNNPDDWLVSSISASDSSSMVCIAIAARVARLSGSWRKRGLPRAAVLSNASRAEQPKRLLPQRRW